MTACPTIKVAKGDKLSMKAHFDMEAHPARESSHGEMSEAMALFVGVWVSATPA
ncbi:hypothetical protein BT63DRAFT_428001 [Microthyrium microscopicum]|uniref:Uncharacterized protein n=1 Tax=Microthyrium microscopicum TaxID=703497 RepID=A0A6A6U276_9PEZI|nr:hypothetical protein BT63DRAFT_428001 [Microthyrium microscopicum]